MLNPAQTTTEIKKEFIGYISTTFHFRDVKLQQRLEQELNANISKGPFVEIKNSFKSGKSLNEMIDDGVLSPLFKQLEKGKKYPPKLPLDRPLYLHQEKAIEKIVEGKNVVISTGTGSGKTHCFLIPVINELLREKEQNTLTDGVRAIFIYPMNALANDQIKGLREILMSYPDIRFGVYNGGTENREADAIKLYEAMYNNEKSPELRKPLPNELLSRDEMKKHPPHILFTNYAMLEHMLFRPGDDVIFSNSNFKFVVLDEAHVYTGATGIETSFLMGRLKGRMRSERDPQFILTSATLGDGSDQSNKQVAEFAQQLTGCDFSIDDIVMAYREHLVLPKKVHEYQAQLFTDLANEEMLFSHTLQKYGIPYDANIPKAQVLYELISSSEYYHAMNQLNGLITLKELSTHLQITQNEAVSFIGLCTQAQKAGKVLMDIRYHFFLRALDGCYLALNYPESLSLIRKDSYKTSYNSEVKMFEIAVCDDCGEIAIVGRIDESNRLVRANNTDEQIMFQPNLCKTNNDEVGEEYVLCKNCGAIVPLEEAHNEWCKCGHTDKLFLKRLAKDDCANCGGTLRRFRLGYDAATGVIATSLFDHIPEYTITIDEDNAKKSESFNVFLQGIKHQTTKTRTGSQFIVFSDSRQGAAKFACFLGDMYKQFLRRRGVWNVIDEIQNDYSYKNGIHLSDFVQLLKNYFSNHRLFRENNIYNGATSVTENNRNAWVAVLDELYNCNRSTSLVSLGRLSFEYRGNTDNVVRAFAQNYTLSFKDAKNFLNFLAFEIVRTGAIITDKETDINDSDRNYLYFSPSQKVAVGHKENQNNQIAYIPSSRTLKTGEKSYYRSRKLIVTKAALNIEDEEAVKLIENYWEYLISPNNEYRLLDNGNGFCIKASSFDIHFGKDAQLWRCKKCGKVSQFNIKDKCCQIGCKGGLERLNSEDYCENNYYAMLYRNAKMRPLFVKEHTAQLSKKEALEYQQQFVRKEINALSCSTTFEMGVDVGDLETVFLRNIPPLASNYAQRVGRAGRSANAAALAVTYAKLSSHDFTFFDQPKEMINGTITPPFFNINNEKILRRHVYAIALSLYFKDHPELYSANNADKFINEKGYLGFFDWLRSKPEELSVLIKKSLKNIGAELIRKYLDGFEWVEEFCGDNGSLSKIIREFEQNIDYLEKEYKKAYREKDLKTASVFERKWNRYKKNDLIDFLVRGNILPKYGFPIDSVELTQNISSKDFRTLNLNRDLAVAIAEYAPSSEIVANGELYTSRYIRKPVVNKSEMNDFEIAYISKCPDCDHDNFSNVPIDKEGISCAICDRILKPRNFHKSIEPRAGFIAEEDVKDVPLTSQERKYKTEAIYIGDKSAKIISTSTYTMGSISVQIESTANDSLVVKSTNHFFVCPKCGYSIASDETSKLKKYEDYEPYCSKISKTSEKHSNPFGKGYCAETTLNRYYLHHEFKTDVAKISFSCDTSDYSAMLSVMYALLNSFSEVLNIERRDIKACLTYKKKNGVMEHKIIIYDAVPGGAGHSRRLVTENGNVFKDVVRNAVKTLSSCECSPSCYRCLRSYENQKVHEILNREKALAFLMPMVEEMDD